MLSKKRKRMGEHDLPTTEEQGEGVMTRDCALQGFEGRYFLCSYRRKNNTKYNLSDFNSLRLVRGLCYIFYE